MTSMLGIGPRPIAIGKTRVIFAVAGLAAAVVVLAVPGLGAATRAVELIAGALIATLLYEPLQHVNVPVRHAPTAGAISVLVGIALTIVGFPALNSVFHTIGAQFVFTTMLTTGLFGCMFFADRMRAIWQESL